jgi:predicted transcriptional regulator
MTIKVKGKMDLAGVITKDGEFIPLEFTINAFIPRNPRDREPYIKVYGEKILTLIKDNKLRGSELSVFLWFIAKSSSKKQWNNEWIYVDYEDLANELGFRKETVQRAIKKLLDLNFIVQWKPRKTAFRLNPEYCFKGGIIAKRKIEKEIETLNLESETLNEFIEKAVEALKEEPEKNKQGKGKGINAKP